MPHSSNSSSGENRDEFRLGQRISRDDQESHQVFETLVFGIRALPPQLEILVVTDRITRKLRRIVGFAGLEISEQILEIKGIASRNFPKTLRERTCLRANWT